MQDQNLPLLSDFPIEKFAAIVDLERKRIFIGSIPVGEIVSNHDPAAKQISLRVIGVNGHEYLGRLKRRNGPSRVTFTIVRRLNERTP